MAQFKDIIIQNRELVLKPDGLLYSKDNKPVSNLGTNNYSVLKARVNQITTIGDVKIQVTENEEGLVLTQYVDIAKLVEEHKNIEVDLSSGCIKTLAEVEVAKLSSDTVKMLAGAKSNKLSLNNQLVYLSRSGNKLYLKNNLNTFNTINDIINFGLGVEASNITITGDYAKYKVKGVYRNLDKIFTEKDCQNLIIGLDKNIPEYLRDGGLYNINQSHNGTGVNIKILKDGRYTIVIDFLKNTTRTVTDFFEPDWLKYMAQRNKSDTGGIVIISEKQSLPEIIPLFLDNVATNNDTVVFYNKTINFEKGNIMNFTDGVSLDSLTSYNIDVLVTDFISATKSWESIFEMVDNGCLVTLIVSETSIYSTLNMVTESFDKNYQYRKFIEVLQGLSIVNLQYQEDKQDFEVKYEFVYNNSQFKTLLGSKTYNRVELADPKYKFVYFNLTGGTKSIEQELKDILIHANVHKAHDISLSAGSPPMFRISKDLVPSYTNNILKPYMTESLYLEIVKDGKLREDFKRDPGEGVSCALSVPGVGRYRVSVYRQRGSVSLSLRKIPDEIWTMDKCGIPKKFQELIDTYSQGLILVTGPTGTGKSTTMASMIDHINMVRRCKIITTEDPIEFLYKSKSSLVEQIELGEDTDSYFKTLKRNLRNDPDILVIGEIRDSLVLQNALNAATSGHLVFGTLHTKSAISTINRTIDMTPKEDKENIKSLLSQNLLATYTQVLLPRVGGGMVPAMEVMVNTPAVASSISIGTPEKLKDINQYLNSDRASGMRSIDYSIAEAVAKGQCTIEDAEVYCTNFDLVTRFVESLRSQGNQE